MKYLLTIALAVISQIAFAQNPVGVFSNHADIGHPKIKGDASYDAATQTYNLKGAGYNIWFNRDEFQYAYKKIAGDFILTANFEFTGDKGNEHRKIGWMIRESADDAAAAIVAVSHGDGLGVLQWRSLRGSYMRDPQDEIFFPKKTPNRIIQLERSGKKIIMRVANYGEPLQEVGSHEMPDMPDSVLAGLFICSHDSNAVEQARVWNVRIDKPVPNDYSPSPALQKLLPQQPLNVGCRLETINVFDGTRKIIRESANRFEAPNWMPDGKQLLFNEGGLLYTIPVEGGTPQQLNTGDVINNNNDHGISFDGKTLAISSHRKGMTGGGSTVYVLPLTGGTPKQVTDSTPSYWHGWNPNNKEVVFVGQRNGSKI